MEAMGLTPAPAGRRHRPPAARPSKGPPASPQRWQLASDESLVAGVRECSEEAFTALWERYQRPLLSYCRHVLGSYHEAEEAVQQAFANAYRALAGDDERELHAAPVALPDRAQPMSQHAALAPSG